MPFPRPLTLQPAAFAGMTVGPLGLRRWRNSTRAQRHVVLWGDSVVQGHGIDAKSEGFVEKLRRNLRTDFPGTVHEGFQPVVWAFVGTPTRWARTGTWTDASATASNLSPHGQANSAVRAAAGASRTLVWTRPADVEVEEFHVLWVDDSTTGAAWSYSTNGGGAWTTVPATAPGSPTLKAEVITASNPTDIRIRNADGAGVLAATPVFLGGEVYGPDPTGGLVVHNVGVSGASLANPTSGALGSARGGTWSSLFVRWAPEMVVFGFSNDAIPASFDPSALASALATMRLTLAFVGSDLVAFGFPEQSEFAGRTWANQTEVRALQVAAGIAGGAAPGAALNMRARWGPVGSVSGLMSGAVPIHPTAEGDQDIAAALARLLRTHG